VDEAVARLAATLGAAYGLRAIDAVHLATAVAAGAERFLTNNSSDFGKAITEIDVIYPNDLAEPDSPRGRSPPVFRDARAKGTA
jgi:hypothetical protein